MKSLTTLLKNALSTLCLLFVLCMTSDAQLLQNFTRVQQNNGLIMQRIDHETGQQSGKCIMNFHADDDPQHPGYIYMRATAGNNNNNVILNDQGVFMIHTSDECAEARLPDFGTATDSIKLYVNGSIAVSSGNATNIITSDMRFKKNIAPLKNSLEVIRQSNFVEFQYNDLSGMPSRKKYYGILAQEMEKILPNTIIKSRKKFRGTDKQKTEFLMFNPNDLIYSGLNAIKELDKENQELKDRVIELEEKVEENKGLEERVVDLEKMLAQLIDKEYIGEDTSVQTINSTTSSYLYQNQPNPIYNSTNIQYHLPDDTSNAKIVIQDLNGTKITEFSLKGDKAGNVTFNAIQYGISSGTYLYSLIINETIIESKKMIFID